MQNKSDDKHPVRVWVDGCFDLVHYGHANAIRQAKAMGDVLVVGVHSDEDIYKHKGPTVYTQEERIRIVSSIKWVDEVVPNAPYIVDPDFVFEINRCDFVVHGDDLSPTNDGVDTYHRVKAAGRYKEFKRTAGVSTTDLVGRMLLLTKSHHVRDVEFSGAAIATTVAEVETGNAIRAGCSDKGVQCDNLGVSGQLNTQDLASFVSYVSNVVMGAPYVIDAQLLDYFKVDLVVHGWTAVAPTPAEMQTALGDEDPYEEAKRRGIFRHVQSGSVLTTASIIQRIIANRLRYEERNRTKEAKEIASLSSHISPATKELNAGCSSSSKFLLDD